MPLQARNDIHLARRLWHFFGVMFMAGLCWMMTPRQAAIATIACSGFMISFDSARLFSKRLNRFFTWIFAPVMRETERRRPTAATAMMAGVTLIVLLYPKNVVLLTLMFLAVAD